MGMLDLRPEAGQVRADFDRTLRIGRLQTLARYGLASGERARRLESVGPIGADAARTWASAATSSRRSTGRSNRAATSAPWRAIPSMARRPTTQIVGRVIDKRLTDELGERLGLVVDGVDGRVHHVALGSEAMANAAEEATIGSIVEIAPAPTGPRPADRNIARLAQETGDYRPSVHRAMAEAAGVRVPGGDYGAYVESHVRRLEALRRAGIVERIDADHWRIPADFETRAADYDAQRRGRMTLRLLSNLDLEAQIDANGATWLDRELTSPNRDAAHSRRIWRRGRRGRWSGAEERSSTRATPGARRMASSARPKTSSPDWSGKKSSASENRWPQPNTRLSE